MKGSGIQSHIDSILLPNYPTGKLFNEARRKSVKKTLVSTPQSSRSSKTDIPKTPGSNITEGDLGRKKAFPLSIHYTEKFLLHNGLWCKRESAGSRAPAAVELLNAEGASKFNIDGGLTDNSILREGQPIPKEIIAVVRPSIVIKENGDANGRTDQQSIVPDEMEMNLEVKVLDFTPPDAEVLTSGKDMKVAYTANTKATMKQDVQGLYCFSTSGNQLEHLFKQIGTYMFHFSLVDSKYGGVSPATVRVNVAPSNANSCEAHGLAHSRVLQRRKRRSKHASGSVGGSVDIEPVVQDGIDDDDFGPEPKQDITQIHVTTLDAVCSVNGFFTIAVFLGLGNSPPLPQNQAATTLAPARLECYVQINVYRAVVLWEVVSFGCFLFSTLVAHGFKLYIVLQNGKNKENSKTAEIDHNFLRCGILSASVGSILGAIFLIVSMVVLIEIRLGDLTCNGDHVGNPWAMYSTIPFLLLGVSGCVIFITAVFYEAIRSYSIVVVRKLSGRLSGST